jgi:hypothetical protein
MVDTRLDPTDQLHETLRMLYCEHTEQARHHDALRERSTAVIVALAVALATGVVAYVELANDEASWLALALSVPIIGAGGFGMYLAQAHFQSNRQHVQIARAFRLTLQIMLEHSWNQKQGKVTINETDRKSREAIKWLAEELPKVNQTQAALRIRSWEVFDSIDSTYRVGTKGWYEAIRARLDDSIQRVAPYDFRTIRDYGQARYNLKWFEGEHSFWSRHAAKGWIWVNAVVAIYGIGLCIWILERNSFGRGLFL